MLPRISVMATSLVLALSQLAFTVSAETIWLNDELWVNVRTGPSTDARGIKLINSGTRMEVLEKPDGSSFWRVRTEGGLEGWVPTRYVTDQPTGDLQVANLTAENEQLKLRLSDIEEKYSTLLDAEADIEEFQVLREQNIQLTEELESVKTISENALNLDNDYQALAERSAALQNELDVLSAENRSLKEHNNNQRMYIGGGLVVLGIILGTVLPKLGNRRRKDSW